MVRSSRSLDALIRDLESDIEVLKQARSVVEKHEKGDSSERSEKFVEATNKMLGLIKRHEVKKKAVRKGRGTASVETVRSVEAAVAAGYTTTAKIADAIGKSQTLVLLALRQLMESGVVVGGPVDARRRIGTRWEYRVAGDSHGQEAEATRA